jgi:hypothetical protein
MNFFCLEGPAPEPPEFIARWATRGAETRKAESRTLPLGTAPGVGARVTLQRCPILRSGNLILPPGLLAVVGSIDVIQLGSSHVSTRADPGGSPGPKKEAYDNYRMVTFLDEATRAGILIDARQKIL